MKQWCPLYVFLYSYRLFVRGIQGPQCGASVISLFVVSISCWTNTWEADALRRLKLRSVTATSNTDNGVFSSTFPQSTCYRYFSHHDDVIKWKPLPRYWPFVRGIHRSSVNSPHKDQWRGALMCFDVFFDPRLNKRLSKQSWGWWFETPSR